MRCAGKWSLSNRRNALIYLITSISGKFSWQLILIAGRGSAFLLGRHEVCFFKRATQSARAFMLIARVCVTRTKDLVVLGAMIFLKFRNRVDSC